MINLQNAAFSYDKNPFIRDFSCDIPDGRITALLGPNGSGKSTLVRLCAGLLRPDSGDILINSREIRNYSPRQLARELAFLPQSRPTPPLRVRTLVENGRFPYLGLSRKLSFKDTEAVDNALEAVGLTAMADRELATLSGGERQKAYVAMLIAQGAQHLLLDEPTTYLDVAHQLELMQLMLALKSQGRCIVMVMHDIDLAMQYCDDILVMQRGKLLYKGSASKLLHSGAIEAAYGVRPSENTGIRFERM